ncbi:proteasome protein [Corynebacterium yudongzhengii]|uniref:PAC2 family protein n=1 Tax=Corynebacterium yudongzhengii TaxID=2080740 RepID=A0A2U1T562_9CORY|nr:PAC2 family protein [Corynebacterium yudongzhengii]AWB81763.1 proteasome protein [Corynebacterium yudongzhengii]PWC01028.1 PAC2 family protein [Corynebacterium yudongzhengii]
MHDESKMYEIEYPAPAVGDDSARGPVMIVALQGFADAGHVVDASARHLKAALNTKPMVSFNNDELIDYRSRRPAVTMTNQSITNVEELNLDMRVARDNDGTPFLLLSGPEPDLRWEAFTDAVADLADKYNVSSTICLYGAPMTVPHTRPLVVSGHGNDPELVADLLKIDSQITMPGSAQLFIERELHTRGHKVAGYTAHVPHYLAQWPYPQGTYQLLTSVSRSTGLNFPLRSLEVDIERARAQLDEYMSDNQEVMQVVGALEEQYDEEIQRYREAHPNAMLPGEQAMPTGEELGAEFERFLASIDDQMDPEKGPRALGGEDKDDEERQDDDNRDDK